VLLVRNTKYLKRSFLLEVEQVPNLLEIWTIWFDYEALHGSRQKNFQGSQRKKDRKIEKIPIVAKKAEK